MNKTLLIVLILAVAVLGGAWWYVGSMHVPDEEEIFCTADAMQCPNGSYVGRTGPNCEFVCPEEAAEREVSLHYYNPALDQGPGGAQCTSSGLVSVQRNLPGDATVAEVIELLLKGELSEEELAQGIETEFPLEGVELVSAVQEGEALTLTFNDPQNRTSGGACRVSVLWLQIEATAKEFSGASEVLFVPEELFQP